MNDAVAYLLAAQIADIAMPQPVNSKPTAITRRTLLATGAAVAGTRFLPRITAAKGRWIVTVAFDKAAGAMRIVERLVH